MPSLINKSILDNIDFIKDSYINNVLQEDREYFNLVTSPFKVIKLRNLLISSEYKKELQLALDSLELNQKNNDLYSLWQSDDLKYCELKPIKKFVHILKTEIGPLLSDICDVKLNERLTITASLYTYGDVLLCHDDKCSDRCIAFVYYLNGSTESGGSFDMFSHDEVSKQPTEIVRSLPPEENTFISFEVGNLTYHQVSEVTDKEFQRWSINGWFHSDRKLPLLKYVEPLPPLLRQIKAEGLIFLNEYLNPMYCTPSNLEQMQEEFLKENYLYLKKIFRNTLFETFKKELMDSSNGITWKKVGPANRRNYYVADLNNLPGKVDTLVKLLMSPMFIAYIKNLSSLSIEPYEGEGKPSSKFTLQLIKWVPGCYTMATDNDEFFKTPGLDLFLFFGSENLTKANSSSGFITYLDSGDDDESMDMEEDRELLTIDPDDNALALVYREDKTVSFTKYVNHSLSKEYYTIYGTYYEEIDEKELEVEEEEKEEKEQREVEEKNS